jgi:hypothetical protein
MTNDDLAQYVLRYFGKEVVDVELSARQLVDIQGDAFRWFNDRKGLRCNAGLILTGAPQYDLSSLNPAVQEVLSVAFPHATDVDLRAIYGDDLALPGVPWGMFPYGALQGGVYSSLVQAVQYRKTASKVISADLDWEFRRVIDPLTPGAAPKPMLGVTPGFNGPQGQAIIRYKAKLTSMDQLANDDRGEDFVVRRAVIAAKARLGQIRGKWQTLPTARGERSMNGSELLSSAAEELKDLNDDMASTNMPIPFFTA